MNKKDITKALERDIKKKLEERGIYEYSLNAAHMAARKCNSVEEAVAYVLDEEQKRCAKRAARATAHSNSLWDIDAQMFLRAFEKNGTVPFLNNEE